MKNLIVILFLGLFGNIAFTQTPAHLVKPSDTLSKDAFINTVEQSLQLFLADYANQNNYDEL
jgi:hypothetical protein